MNTRPTEPGLYWYRPIELNGARGEWSICRVSRDEDYPQATMLISRLGDDYLLDLDDDSYMEWGPPVTMLEELNSG